MTTEEGEISFLLFITKMYESTENHEKMREAITKLTKVKCNKSLLLSVEERNLLSVAYNNCAGERRSSWRVLCCIEEKLLEFSDAKSANKLKILSDFKECVRSELIQICTEMIDLLDSYLLPVSARIVREELFYTRMKADYCRYLGEVETGDKKEIATAKRKREMN